MLALAQRYLVIGMTAVLLGHVTTASAASIADADEQLSDALGPVPGLAGFPRRPTTYRPQGNVLTRVPRFLHMTGYRLSVVSRGNFLPPATAAGYPSAASSAVMPSIMNAKFMSRGICREYLT